MSTSKRKDRFIPITFYTPERTTFLFQYFNFVRIKISLMKEKKEKKKLDSAEEPEADYNRITISTFVNLEKQDIERARNLSPLERMEYLQKLIHITHGNDLIKQEEAFYKGKITIRKLA